MLQKQFNISTYHTFERYSVFEHFPQQHSETVHVGFCVEVLFQENLRGEIVDRTEVRL